VSNISLFIEIYVAVVDINSDIKAFNIISIEIDIFFDAQS
jgi:hypothetical protein